jgi:two-component system C4-dicarboxylate transport response regulator DctD
VLGLASGADGLLSARSATPVPLADQVGAFERAVIEQELRRAAGSIADVSVALGVPKQTLYYKVQKYGLSPDDYK